MLNGVALLALDLDDTLLRGDLSISRHTRAVLRRAEKAGLTVLLASGRAPKAMERYVRELGMDERPGFIVANNGTTILDSRSGEVLREVRLPTESALRAFDLVDSEGLPVQVYEGDTIYVSRRNEFADQDQKLTGLRQVVVSNFRSMIAAGQLKLVIPGDPMVLRPIESLLKTYVGQELTIFTSKPYFLEVLPPACGKGEALAWVAESLGVERAAVMAVGDSMNDESMIRWAGRGVAMVNGDERIKALAVMTTEFSNEEDGVAELVRRYLLDGDPLPPARGDEG